MEVIVIANKSGNNANAYLAIAITVTSLQIIPSIIVDTILQPIDRITILRQVMAMKELGERSEEDTDNEDLHKESMSSRSSPTREIFDHSPSVQKLSYYKQFSDPKQSIGALLAKTTEEQGISGHFTGIVCQTMRSLSVIVTRFMLASKITSLWRKKLINYRQSSSSSSWWTQLLVSHPSMIILPLNMLSAVVAHPFDVIKTRMITDLETLEDTMEEEMNSEGQKKKKQAETTWFDRVYHFLFDGTNKYEAQIYYRQGFSAFFRGIDAALFSVVSSTFLNVILGTKVKLFLPASAGYWTKFASQLLVRCLVTTVLYPFEVAKRRMMLKGAAGWRRQGMYSNSFDCLVKMVKQEGVMSLYSGYRTHLLRQVPNGVLTDVLVNVMKYQTQFLTQMLLSAQ